ncbi:MAG: TonB family protein [Acidobacteria bacterium]|nr:TonB family protein [Acidobacteriota bacterium]
MKSLAEPPTPAAHEPDFLVKLGTPEEKRRRRRAVAASILLHIAAVLILPNIQFEAQPPRPGADLTIRRITPLAAPPPILEPTQKAANTEQPSKEFDLRSLLARPEVKAPPAQAALSPKPKPGLPQPSLPDAPQLAEPAPQLAQQLPPQGMGVANQPPPRIPPPAEKPKLVFESVGAGRSTGNVAGGTPQIQTPKTSVDEAIARVTRRPGGGLVVGDDADLPSLGESLSQQAVPGKLGSSLELLSDPQGADFRPYLLRVLAAVRRNWFAVIPESARMGRRGKVSIQFAISRDGHVPKLVISMPSGFEPMDRAAVAGISASNPFPPLPAEYRGAQIRLQLSFVYNAQR